MKTMSETRKYFASHFHGCTAIVRLSDYRRVAFLVGKGGAPDEWTASMEATAAEKAVIEKAPADTPGRKLADALHSA